MFLLTNKIVGLWHHRLREATQTSVEYKDQIRAQTEQLAAYQSEIEHLRKSIGNLEDDCEKDRKRIEALTEALIKARLVCVPPKCTGAHFTWQLRKLLV